MKRKIFTLLFSAYLGTMAMAEAPQAVVKKAAVAPIIDGVMDAVWMGANTYNVALPFKTETPTLGAEGSTTWKGLWTDEGIYVLVKVNDDEWYPAYANSASDNWMYDKVEIYFDVNAELKDGLGGKNTNPSDGHIQVSPAATEDGILGTMIADGDGEHAFMVNAPTWMVEYFVPFSRLIDKDGLQVDPTRTMGFDVTVIDGESAAPGARQRAVWSNNGNGPSANESWGSMDDCGTIILSDEVAESGTVVKKTDVAPVIDGVIDVIWENTPANNIVTNFQAEVPTLGEAGETTWKALYNSEGMYILLQVTDDEWYPSWKPTPAGNDYEYDKPEIYFDVNSELKDGLGAKNSGDGHWQVAPGSSADALNGEMKTATIKGVDYNYAFKITDPNYVAEYFVPWDLLVDKDGTAFDKTSTMGFDVTIIDRETGDAARKRAVWANDGKGASANESWASMDDCGKIMFDGVTEVVYVEKIKVSGGNSITTDNGTLQMAATVEPAEATAQKVKWVVENGTGRATISKEGLLTATTDGTVLVKAMASDDSYVEGKVTVTISGQKIQYGELSVIKGGNFDKVDNDGTVADLYWGACDAVVVEGAAVCSPKPDGVNSWDWKMGQKLDALPNIDYVLSFKAWAEADREIQLNFEDPNNAYERYGASTDEGAQFGGRSEWKINITTEPTWINLHVNFDRIKDNTSQDFSFRFGLSDIVVSLDSVTLVSVDDLALKALAMTNMKSKVQLYPNPVQTELTVSQIALANSKVSIFNAVGQNLVEKTANGTQAKFDVSNLRKGMYFVRFTDGSSQKFIKQ